MLRDVICEIVWYGFAAFLVFVNILLLSVIVYEVLSDG